MLEVTCHNLQATGHGPDACQGVRLWTRTRYKVYKSILCCFQLGVFAGGMSSFVDDGSQKDEKVTVL
jgi:hypothetical protein